MSEIQNLNNLLNEIVADYSTGENPHLIKDSPAEIGKHLHPLLARMCEEAEKRGASDIFISSGFPPSIKIDGNLIPVPLPALTAIDTEKIVASTMNEQQQADFVNQLEINYSVQSKGNVRYRVNAYHEQGRCGLVMRRINTEIPSVEDLALPLKLKELVMQKRGLLILAGATGSGKSTSMAAMLDHRNRNLAGHIITIEDPIEFVHPHKNCIITQREVGVDTENWFAALKNTLRQAPDVILIGEIRDQETMEYALAFAETGHLCMATLHANSSNQALDRIINFFPEEKRTQLLTDLSLNLQAFVSQRLVPKENGKGRAAAVEVLLQSPLISDLILRGEVHGIKEIMKKSTDIGMQTFDQALYELFESGQISYAEAIKNADSANDLRLAIQLRSRRGQNAGIDFELL